MTQTNTLLSPIEPLYLDIHKLSHMIPRLLLLFAFSLPVCSAQAQKKSFKDYLGPDEKVKLSTYWYMVSKKGDGRYVHRIFFPETVQITSEVTYKNKKLNSKEGLATFWSDKGSKIREGLYTNNKQEGLWTFYHRKSGNKSEEGAYKNGEKEGAWKLYDNEGRLHEELHYRAGLRVGKFISYDSLGTVYNEGVYKADSVFSQSLQLSVDKEEMLTSVEESMPYLAECEHIKDEDERKTCSDRTLITYIQKNIRYPKKARENELEGRALASFAISKNGSIKDIDVFVGLCQPIKEECERIIKNMPPWKPGIQDGKAVEVYYTMPLSFRLK